jgi:hypothetical protein
VAGGLAIAAIGGDPLRRLLASIVFAVAALSRGGIAFVHVAHVSASARGRADGLVRLGLVRCLPVLAEFVLGLESLPAQVAPVRLIAHRCASSCALRRRYPARPDAKRAVLAGRSARAQSSQHVGKEARDGHNDEAKRLNVRGRSRIPK